MLHRWRLIAFFTNPYTGGNAWLLVGKGPDNDWDISFLFESPDVFTEKEIIPFIYDPTNGAKSSGDLIIRSSQIFSPAPKAPPIFSSGVTTAAKALSASERRLI
ncbi:MAG: hypothetical protein NT106_14055 [Candidatus Sumerlaeota bacterium]|nr:hypothetical protein [Candidatus Sumerlaeota bacterium]